MTMPRAARRGLLVILGLLAGIALALAFYVFTQHTPIEDLPVAESVPGPGTPAFVDLVGLNTGTRFTPGNDVEILLDGDTYPRLWSELRRAQRSVTLQLYFCRPGRLADSLAAVLSERARAGVPVLFLYDGFGCDGLGDAYFDALRTAGVRARSFRPVHFLSVHKAQERSHVRIVVIDGNVAFTGGFGIDDRWAAGGTPSEPGWRETNARFTGPAVASLQAAFVEGWAETTGELLVEERFFPRARTDEPTDAPGTPAPADTAGATDPVRVPADAGTDSARWAGVVAGAMHAVPDLGSTSAERLLALTIASARRTLYIANAYFIPDDDFRRLLVDAVARGVDVRVLTPDAQTDVPVVRWAARAHYEELLEGGVRLFEYRPAMMHAKTFVADGVWAGVGSMNFDNRSLAVNDEVMLLVQDPGFGARLDSVFLADLRRAREIRLDSFRDRGIWSRFLEGFAAIASRVL
jgi:cardiolipin synthase